MEELEKDSLGDRMKGYELDFRTTLPLNTYTVIRIDGKAFHTYTRGLIKPFDKGLVDDMIATTKRLCEKIQGVKLGYVQSDEISLILTDFDSPNTQAWFGNQLQKMVSVSASMATAKFNHLRMIRSAKENSEYFLDFLENEVMAEFDSRVYQLPSLMEVSNYLLWRQQDCIRNSISGAAQSMFSPRQLHGIKTDGMQEMIATKGYEYSLKLIRCGYEAKGHNAEVNGFDQFNSVPGFTWSNTPEHLKVGTTIVKQTEKKYFTDEIFNKDIRPVDVKLSSDWFYETDGLGKSGYYKMVNQWTPLPFNYEGHGLGDLVPVMVQKEVADVD